MGIVPGIIVNNDGAVGHSSSLIAIIPPRCNLQQDFNNNVNVYPSLFHKSAILGIENLVGEKRTWMTIHYLKRKQCANTGFLPLSLCLVSKATPMNGNEI